MAVQQCTAKAAARLQLYRWVLFNYLLGNGDNHLKNLSFHISHESIQLAPAYDLLCTAIYDTQAFSSRPSWPRAPLALSLGEATRFDQVSRVTLLQAGQTLGLTPASAQRELNRMLTRLATQADHLLAEIEAGYPACIAASPEPQQAALHQAGELRLLHAIRHVVLADTLGRVQE